MFSLIRKLAHTYRSYIHYITPAQFMTRFSFLLLLTSFFNHFSTANCKSPQGFFFLQNARVGVSDPSITFTSRIYWRKHRMAISHVPYTWLSSKWPSSFELDSCPQAVQMWPQPLLTQAKARKPGPNLRLPLVWPNPIWSNTFGPCLFWRLNLAD